MKEIPLRNRRREIVAVAIVDDEDYDALILTAWCRSWNGYAVRGTSVDGRFIPIFMHRQILSAPKGMFVDHRDCNKLNNCRVNLRLATSSQNNANRAIDSRNKSGFKGVKKHRRSWVAQITKDNRVRYIGSYATPEAAHAAYLAEATRLHGEFAHG